MLLNEISNPLQNIQYHKRLHPKIWHGTKLYPRVRRKLLNTAQSFTKTLNIPDMDVKDVTITGSLANYNYNPTSDIDLHILVNFFEAECPAWVENLFNSKRSLWDKVHDVRIFGFPVAPYMQDSQEEHHSSGVYSILHDKWVVKPSRIEFEYDDSSVLSKFNEFAIKINKLLDDPDVVIDDIEEMQEEIHQLRVHGLEKEEGEEFSTGNLVFKLLRSSGVLNDLRLKRINSIDAKLSIS